MEAGGRARVRKKKKKCRDIYFAFIVSNFRLLFFLPLVSLFHPFLAELCRLVPYYLRKAREKLKITASVLRLEWEFCVFTVPFQVQLVFFFFLFWERKKKKGTLLELYSVALDDCDVQSGSNYVEKQKETYLPIGNACFFRAFIWAFSETHRVKSFFTPFTCLGGRGGTGLTTLLACRGCAWTALYSKYRFKMLEPPQAQACRFP